MFWLRRAVQKRGVGTKHKVQGVAEGKTWDTPDRGEEVGHFREVAGMSIFATGFLHSAVDALAVESRVAWINFKSQYHNLGTSVLQIFMELHTLTQAAHSYALLIVWRDNVQKVT